MQWFTGVDTNGLLDRCSRCGERAAFHRFVAASYVQCSECAEATDFYATANEAMIVWNKQQRAAQAGKEATK
jgi:uncharacterized protein (DUF983 family)